MSSTVQSRFGCISMSGAGTGLLTGLVSYYELEDNAANTTVADSHGSNTGTLGGGDNTTDKNTTGKVGDCFDFNGSDDYVQVSDDASLDFGSGSLSIVTWVKTSGGTGASQRIIHKQDTDGLSYFILRIDSEGDFTHGLKDTGGDSSVVSYGGSFDDGNWHQLGLIINRSEQKQYVAVDGSIYETDADISNVDSITNDSPMDIGGRAYDNDRWFDGLIDEVGIWTRALTSAEISTLYNSGNGLDYSSF